MTYTVPTTRSNGELIDETAWNTDVVENIKHLYNTMPPAIPSGVTLPYAGAAAPSGWLLCNGQAVNRTTYAALFLIIGTTFGAGDGSTTFNVPDLRGRLPLGKDDMGGSSANRVTNAQADVLGGAAGAETHTLTLMEIPTHNHGLKVATNPSGGQNNLWAGAAATDNGSVYQGGGAAHNNMPPYLTLNYIIKV